MLKGIILEKVDIWIQDKFTAEITVNEFQSREIPMKNNFLII